MKIAVLGGGNGSLAAAVDLTEQGHQVNLWRRDPAVVAAMVDRHNTLQLSDFKGQRSVTLNLITSDIAQAILNTDLVVSPTPANAQSDIATLLAPHLVDGQVVFLPPGSFGSYVMAQTIRDKGCTADVAFAEAGTLPYLTRKRDDHHIAITTRATRLPSGVFPLRLQTHALQVIRSAYPSIEDAGDGLSGALMNAGPIIHPPLILMNAGPIEHFPHWDIHNEGTQPSIRRVTTALDNERIEIREAFGYGVPHFPLADHYAVDGDEWMYGNLAHEKLIDSGDWREPLQLTEHRYMREDVAIGLALLVSLAQYTGVNAPVASGLLALGWAVCGVRFRDSDRTFEALGLAKLSFLQLRSLLQSGAHDE